MGEERNKNISLVLLPRHVTVIFIKNHKIMHKIMQRIMVSPLGYNDAKPII
jgi:hypothetical protein